MARPRMPIAKELVEGRRRIDAWRRTRKTRAMPEALWAHATELGARHGVSVTARVLGVRYDALRRRVAALGRGGDAAQPAFVELRPTLAVPACRVELEDGRGRRMRIDLAVEALGLVEQLGRILLGRRG